MKKVEPYPIANALFFILSIFFVICIAIKFTLLQLGVTGIWNMHKMWELILPGFRGLDLLSVLIGLTEVSAGAYALTYIVVPLYNYLIRKKISEKTKSELTAMQEVKPVLVRFKTLFITLLTYLFVLYTLCIIYDIFVPEYLSMNFLWKTLLPGYTGLTIGNYLLGIIDLIVYSSYIAFIFSKTLNYFESSSVKNVLAES